MENKNEIDGKALGEELKKSKIDTKSDQFDIWKCHECKGEPEFEHADAMKHLQEVHKIDTKSARGTQQMVMHLDGRNWFQTNYEVVIQGMRFARFCRTRRAKNDPMRF